MTIAVDKVTGRVLGQVVTAPTIHTNDEGDTLTYSGIPGMVRILSADGYKLIAAWRVRLEDVR